MRAAATAALVVVAVLLAAPAADAKDFKPGDVRLCGATRCVPLMEQGVLDLAEGLIYSGPTPARRARPPLRVPYLQLRFRDGYVAGIVATARLDRFLSYGVYLERFRRDRWYAVSPALAAELRRIGHGLRPRVLTRAALARSR